MVNKFDEKVNYKHNNDIDILRVIKNLFKVKNVILIFIVGILFASASFAYSKFVLPELFTTSVSMYVNNENGRYTSESVEMSALTTSRNLANSYVVILNNDAVMEKVGLEIIDLYGIEDIKNYFPIDEKNNKKYIKAKYIKNCFNISPVNETEILEVSATTTSPYLSADLCNSMTRVAPEFLKRVIGAGSVNAIDVASVPDSKSSPNIAENTVKGFLAGIFLVVVILFIKMLLDTKIRDTENFKDRFDYPVFGEIPFISLDSENEKGKKGKKKKKGVMEIIANGSFQTKEAYNTICNNLLVTMSMNDEKIIVISSPEMSDGKSTVSIKLSKAIANMGKKVLLMDLDLRRPSIHKKLNITSKYGIIDVMAKSTDFDGAIYKNFSENMDILLSGGISPNPSEILSSKRMKEILEEAKEKYDYIIIDSPPINLVTDSCIISKLAAGLMIVIKANENKIEDFRKTLDNIEISRSNLIGVVINGVDTSSTRYGKKYNYKYGYGYGYGYGYRYGYNYSSENSKEKKEKKVQQ